MQDEGQDTSADFDSQGATSRPGGQAEGGSAARPDDSVSPQQAAPGDAAARKAMRDAGFGDDKGGDIS